MENKKQSRWKRVVLRSCAIYLVAWGLTVFIGCPQAERQRLAALRIVPQSELDFASKMLLQAEQRRLFHLKQLEESTAPEEIEYLSRFDLDPIPPDRYPSFWANTSSPAPFVIVIEAGRSLGQLCGSGDTKVVVWFFGLAFESGSSRRWIS